MSLCEQLLPFFRRKADKSAHARARSEPKCSHNPNPGVKALTTPQRRYKTAYANARRQHTHTPPRDNVETVNTETWVRPRPQLASLKGDALLAVGLAIAATATSQLYARMGLVGDPPPAWVWVLGIGFATLPLVLRRRYPVTVMAVVAVAFYVCGQFGVPEILVINISMFLAVYSVGAWSQHRVAALWARVLVVVAMITWLVVTLLIASSDIDFMPQLSRVSVFSEFATFMTINIITNLLFFGAASYFGEKSWRGARTLAQLEAQGRELERERATSAEQAVALDRLSLARELHDVIAHHVSVMGLHAAAARRTLEGDPQKAHAALEIVEQSAEASITELRQIVHTLRTPEREYEAQTVGVAQLSELVEHSVLAGVPTALIVAGEPRPLPMLVDIALYRVAQEALTNVRKHAGSGAAAEVRLRFTAYEVHIEVSDDGVVQKLGGPATDGALGGLGLRGMRERMGAVGGTLETRRRERGGFLVRGSVALPTQGAGADSTSPRGKGENE